MRRLSLAVLLVLACNVADGETGPRPESQRVIAPSPRPPAELASSHAEGSRTREVIRRDVAERGSGSGPTPQKATGRLHVVARLVDLGARVPHCGVLHSRVVMKFEVLRVTGGTYAEPWLYAVVSCPEMPPSKTRGFSWAVGERYELELQPTPRRFGSMIDAFATEPGPRHALRTIEPAESRLGRGA